MSTEELEKKWLNDKLTHDELSIFKELEDYELNKEILETAQNFKAANFSTVSSYEDFKANLPAKKEVPVIKLQQFKKLYRIAAIFVVSLGLYFAFFANSITTVKTLASKQDTIELPDASSVTLNANSQIAYSKSRWNSKREVTLEGEAYFKVAKGAKFDVKTTTGVVSVLGTQFTVKQRDNYFEVKCFEGVVSVQNNNTTHKLTAGKTYRLLNGIATLNTTVKNSPDWLHNITNFESVPLIEVLNELERQYNVTINRKDIDVNRIFTGGFVHNNLEQALQSITIPLELRYKNDNKNTVTLYKQQ